jgi:hypothetical protein
MFGTLLASQTAFQSLQISRNHVRSQLIDIAT